MKIVNIKLNLHGTKRLATGHPWVRRRDMNHFKALPPAGTLVRFQDASGDFLGHGFSDGATGEIAFRVLTLKRHPEFNQAFFDARVERALGSRRGLMEQEPQGAFRLVNGENDHLPGLFCDCFGPFAVMDVLSPGAQALYLPWVEQYLQRTGRFKGLLRKIRFTQGGKATRTSAKKEVLPEVAFGQIPEERFPVTEGGMKLLVALREGAHEGLFLDQRGNRRLVASVSAGAEVLNCFCYTGAFSLACLLNGAARTVNVDISRKALDWAKDNLRLNHLDPEAQEWHAAEAFEILRYWKKKGRQFGLIIQDPPPFSRSRHGVFQAEKHYAALAAGTLSLVKPGGHAAFSCGVAGLARSTFFRYLAEAAQAAGVACACVSPGVRGEDFPYLEGFPEGQHQKFALVQVKGAVERGELTGVEACV